MTIKQFDLHEFHQALDQYDMALEMAAKNKRGWKKALIFTSLRIHAAKGRVPKKYWPLVTNVFRKKR